MAKLSALINKYKGDHAKLHTKSCIELGNRIVEDTPVDTGRAKQSWSAVSPPRLGSIYKFTSTLSYIRPLEYGHSPQASGGMLRINVRNWNSIVAGNL